MELTNFFEGKTEGQQLTIIANLEKMLKERKKQLKENLTKNLFDERLNKIKDKLPHNYAVIVCDRKRFDIDDVRRVKNGRLYNWEILEALEELITN
ncbi:MAG: hypothetical protein MUC49_14970 [Raineya sp.]|jgi:hypothetical protein|nr:hypothetical protein [Raineya sp.]